MFCTVSTPNKNFNIRYFSTYAVHLKKKCNTLDDPDWTTLKIIKISCISSIMTVYPTEKMNAMTTM